ncbi:hypothetical protein [Paenibacillus sp. MBLB4367]|uniref:hypothetical protein n=1 Tax=Paenibacillus sp. MBLB4367 TaxID=3384767 RepID=UPI0039080F10
MSVAVDKRVLLDKRQIDGSVGAGGGRARVRIQQAEQKKTIFMTACSTDVAVVSLEEESGRQEMLFSKRLTGWQGGVGQIRKAVNASVDWAIDTF